MAFAYRFELPTKFGERVSKIHGDLDKAQASESAKTRREHLAIALFESCQLLSEVNDNILEIELSQILAGQPSVNQLPLPPDTLEIFVGIEFTLLEWARVRGRTIKDIESLIRKLADMKKVQIQSSDDVVQQFRRFRDTVCELSRAKINDAENAVARRTWFGLGGAMLVLIDLAAAAAAAAATAGIGVGVVAISSAVGTNLMMSSYNS